MMTTAGTCSRTTERRGGAITRSVGYALRVMGSIAVTLAVAMGAMVYLVLAMGQRRRRTRAARV